MKKKDIEEGSKEKQSFYSMEDDNIGNIEEVVLDPGCLDSVVGNV